MPPGLQLLFQWSQTDDKLSAQRALCSPRPTVVPYASAHSLRTWSAVDPCSQQLSMRPCTAVSLVALAPVRMGILHQPHPSRRLHIQCRADNDLLYHKSPALGSHRAYSYTYRQVLGSSYPGHMGSAHPPPRDGPCIHGTAHTPFV